MSIHSTKLDTLDGITLNNRKFNKNLISIGGLIFLFAMLVLILIPSWLAHDTKNAEKLYVLFFVLLCTLPLGLPTIYFVLNPRHLLISLEDLLCMRWNKNKFISCCNFILGMSTIMKQLCAVVTRKTAAQVTSYKMLMKMCDWSCGQSYISQVNGWSQVLYLY